MFPCVLWWQGHMASPRGIEVFESSVHYAEEAWWAFGPHLYRTQGRTPPASHFYIWGRQPLKGPQPGVLWEGPKKLRGGRRLLLTVGAWFGGLCSLAPLRPLPWWCRGYCVCLGAWFQYTLSSRPEIGR